MVPKGIINPSIADGSMRKYFGWSEVLGRLMTRSGLKGMQSG